jgi:hypothetical protein
LLEEAAMGVTMICCGHRAAVAENLVKTTVDGWTFHMMVKASELLERFDFVLVVNGHNEPALLIQHPQVHQSMYPHYDVAGYSHPGHYNVVGSSQAGEL